MNFWAASSSWIELSSAYVLLPFMGITAASIARGLVMVASLALTVIALRRKNAVSIDLTTLRKSLIARGSDGGHPRPHVDGVYGSFLLPGYVVLGLIVYLAILRLLKAVREHDIELTRKYLGTREFGHSDAEVAM